MRLSLYGACAVVGVVLAMALSGRASRRVGLAAEATWDAGIFAIVCCFVASRLLLVAGDPKAFVRYPLLVLSLPSLTFAGMVLAGVCVVLYLRAKRLPVWGMLDAFAPSAAVLAVFLELGHLLDGSEPGMPVFQGTKGQVTRLLPVSLCGVALAMALLAVLWILLDKEQLRPGQVAAAGLLLGGLLAFGLDMLSLPEDLASEAWLEPGQWVALGAMGSGALLWALAPQARAMEQAALPGGVPQHMEVR